VIDTPKVTSVDTSAVVRVLEGSLTADQLAVELDKLLPGHSWVINLKGTDAFTTNFPSSEVLNHMVNWGPMDTKSVTAKIRFEKGADNDVYKYEIEKVWVQFRGIPLELREFPIIWAIGTILGVPKAVDTKFTKKHGRCRLKVAVLDPDIIPNFVDVVIGDFVYELQFKVERDLVDGEPYVIDMDSTMDEDKDPEEEDPEDMDHDGNKLGGNQEEQEENKNKNDSVAPSEPHGTGPPTEHLENVEVKQAEVVTTGGSAKPVVVLSQTGFNTDGTAQWKASVLQDKKEAGIINKKKGLCEGTVSPARSSKRTASISHPDSLEKATAMKARRNLDTTSFKGKETQPLSFNSFDNSLLLQSTSLIGALGSNDLEVSASLKKLKDLEESRLAKKKVVENISLEADDISSVCSWDDRMDLEALNIICAGISEDLGDGGCDPLSLQSPVSHPKKSKSKGAKNKKKSKSCSK